MDWNARVVRGRENITQHVGVMSSFFNSETSFRIGPDRVTWAVRALILVNIGAFVAQLLIRIPEFGGTVLDYLVFSPFAFVHGFVWQPFSYMFMHGGLSHLFMNMLWLYFFGSEVERVLGSRQFIRFYVLCGALGVMANFVPMLWQGGHIPYINVVGGSGATMGVLVAFAMLAPDRKLFLFPLPIPITSRTMIIIIIAMNLMNAASPGSNISVATHFGGMLVAYGYMKVRPKIATWQIRRIQNKKRPEAEQDDMADAIDNIFKFQDKDRR